MENDLFIAIGDVEGEGSKSCRCLGGDRFDPFALCDDLTDPAVPMREDVGGERE